VDVNYTLPIHFKLANTNEVIAPKMRLKEARKAKRKS